MKTFMMCVISAGLAWANGFALAYAFGWSGAMLACCVALFVGAGVAVVFE